MNRPAESLFARRFRKFRALRRGWFCFLLLIGSYASTFLAPLFINNRALAVRYQGKLYFPVLGHHYEARFFGQRAIGEARYRELERTFAAAGRGDWVVMPLYPYHPNESLLSDPELPGLPPHSPDRRHWLGTDDRARDVLARLVYGYRISITFALGVVSLSYVLGVAIGASFGFFGGRVDIFGQRLVEIWATLPFLYTVMIVSSIVRPGVLLLMIMFSAFGWIGISFFMRGEFYRERSKDYVAAAVAAGESRAAIMFRHILPNALTPVVSLAPFALVVNISSLAALDVLGFGLPPPTPSWGELVSEGLANLYKWHLVTFSIAALFLTLMMVVFIGEAVREAFDPRAVSRVV
ncbi:MAG: ABC transporter permease subunit [Acidobacteriota bacterium]